LRICKLLFSIQTKPTKAINIALYIQRATTNDKRKQHYIDFLHI